MPFIDFRPAEVVSRKETYISYYARNPLTNKLERQRVRCNHVKGAAQRKRYARLLCTRINEMLYAGWNPFVEKLGSCTSVTIEQALERFITVKAKTSRPDTMRSYRSFVKAFSEWVSKSGNSSKICHFFDRQDVMSFMSWIDRSRRLSNRSYNNFAMFLYTLFDFFLSDGIISSNPAADIPRRKVDKKIRTVIPPDARARIKEYVKEHCPRYYYAMLLCYRLFIRPKEIVMLRISYIDFSRRQLRIPSTVAKNHNDRILGIPDEIMDYFETLREYPSEYFIFATKHTFAPGRKSIAPTRIAEWWKSMRDDLGLPEEYQFYSLKDTGITEMLEKGVPPKFVKELAGHHSLEMTERYTHGSDAMKILEYNKLEF